MAVDNNMSHNSYLCEAHHAEVTQFCLCESKLLYLCPTCLPKHEGHELYPVVQAELFQAIGNNREELKRRNSQSQRGQSFLDRVMEREAAVQSQAKQLMNTVNQSYEMWLEGNHRCFDSLLSTLREETAMLLTRPKYRLSPVTQILLEKLESLNSEDEQIFAHIPEIETLTHLTERCQDACSRASKMWQMEYEDEVIQVLTGRQLGSQKKEVVPDEILKLEAAMHQLQEDLKAKAKECASLEKKIETLSKLGLSQTSQLDDSRLNLKKHLTRISELETLHKELNVQLETTTHQLQALQADLRAQVQHCKSLEQQNESLNKKCLTQASKLTEDKQHLDAALNQAKAVRTELEAKSQRFAFLEREKDVLQREVQSQANKIQANEATFTKSLAAANEQHSVLETRLKKWGITTDPPTDFQEPDYSTPQSRAALAKYGPYSNQDDELVLFKRAPVTEDTGVYIGQWNSRGQRHGYGKYLWKSGDIYEGQWRNGQRTGRGRFIWASNGDVYVGDVVQNKKEGFGTIYYANGSEYSGAWVNAKKHGVGSDKFGEGASQGHRYIGEYLDGNYDGIGAYFWADGDMHVGSWKANKFHGKGLHAWADGRMYLGDFENSDLSGIGCHLWPNGEVYRGQYKQAKKNGQGRLTHPGAIEEGTWVDGVLSGKIR